MTIQDIQPFIPDKHTALLIYVGAIITWKLSAFLRAMKSACSEKLPDGKKGEVSIKRIIPFIFSLLVCYMVISNSKGKGTFNDTAFWGIIGFIALATSIITVTQATNIMDKVSALKSGILNTKTEETNIQKKTETTSTT